MPSIFSKNCVLMGEVDSYCLVCCKLLSAEHDVLAHIQDSKHKHKLSSHHYCDKFQHDHIRKVTGVYFCELCNMTFPTAAKVGLHVTEPTHLERKSVPMLRRSDKCIVYQENILITDNAWNGLVDDTCVLCNVEFEDESVHKSEQSHILNLIKSRVTVCANNDIYRQVDDICQCLTCNKLVSTKAIKEHLNSVEHKNLITKIHKNADQVNDEKKKENLLKDVIANKETQGDDKAIKKSGVKDDDIQSNVDGKTLHTKPVLKKQEPSKSSPIPKDVESFAKQHGLSIVNNKVHCKTCSTNVDATLLRIKEHLKEKKHAEKQSDAFKQKTAKPKKVLIDEFVNVINFVEVQSKQTTISNMEIKPYILINKKYFLDAHNFVGLVKFNHKVICHICEVEITAENISIHIFSREHREMIEKSYVITSEENEFIRQLKSDLYDCTYCAHVERDWDDMLDHLDTDEHKRCKGEHETLLLEYNMSLIENPRNHSNHSMRFHISMFKNMQPFF